MLCPYIHVLMAESSRSILREAFARLSKMGGGPDMKNSIKIAYQNKTIMFSSSGWLNASHVAELYSASVWGWLRTLEIQEYLADLAAVLGVQGPQDLIQIWPGRDGSIWLHPKVALEFVREIDRKLSRWCDLAIDKIFHGELPEKQCFDAACKVLDESRREASEHGRGLMEWRLKKQGLESRVSNLKDQLQLKLGFDDPN